MRTFLRRRIWAPLQGGLRQGVTPEKLAFSSAVGASLGVFPVLGTTSLLCVLAAAVWRLNQVGIQVAN